MRWTVALVAEIEPGQRIEHEIVAVDRYDRFTPATLGLSIAEGEAALAAIPSAGGRGPSKAPRRGRPAVLRGVNEICRLRTTISAGEGLAKECRPPPSGTRLLSSAGRWP
jgi:hypothetical protein